MLEFQHSPLRVEEAEERENHYKRLVWVLDVTPLKTIQFVDRPIYQTLSQGRRAVLPRLVRVVNLNRWSWAFDPDLEDVAVYLDNGDPWIYQLYGRDEALVVDRGRFIEYMKYPDPEQDVRVVDPRMWDQAKIDIAEEIREDARRTELRLAEQRAAAEFWRIKREEEEAERGRIAREAATEPRRLVAEAKREYLEWEAAVERRRTALERERQEATTKAELDVYYSWRHSAFVIALNNAVTLFKNTSRTRAEAKHAQLFVEAKSRLQALKKRVGPLKDQIAVFTDHNERRANMLKEPENQQYFFDDRTEYRALLFCKLHAFDPEERKEFFAAFWQSQEKIKRSFDRFNNTSRA